MPNFTERIGEAAGDMWRTLEQNGSPLSVTQLKNRTELPENLLFSGLGWLAREGKISISGTGKKLEVALK